MVARGERPGRASSRPALLAAVTLLSAGALWASVRPAAPARPVPAEEAAQLPAGTVRVPLAAEFPATPSPEATRDATEPGYWVRFGPTQDREHLTRLVDRVLDRHGVLGRVQTVYTVAGYRVTSGPLRTRTAAEQRRRLLEAVGLRSQVRDHPDGYVLDFGQFRHAPAAERVARAVRSRGYGAVVSPVRAASYAVVVGPVAEKAAAALARTLDGAGVPVSLTRHSGGAPTDPR